MKTARIGDPVAHRRVLGAVGARRLDARIDAVVGAGPWRALADLAADSDATVDTLVAVGAFCAERDLDRAVAVVRRVLVPGGRLVFLEHVARPGGLGLLQRASEPVWSAMPAGCHVHHDVVAALRHGGFVVFDLERCTVPSVVPFLRPWVQGVAMAEAA
jgi:SAM-dependent methyltransferase